MAGAPPRPAGVARWAALTALFSNLAAIKFVLLLGPGRNLAEVLAALASALAVAAAVYARQRWEDARRQATPTPTP